MASTGKEQGITGLASAQPGTMAFFANPEDGTTISRAVVAWGLCRDAEGLTQMTGLVMELNDPALRPVNAFEHFLGYSTPNAQRDYTFMARQYVERLKRGKHE